MPRSRGASVIETAMKPRQAQSGGQPAHGALLAGSPNPHWGRWFLSLAIANPVRRGIESGQPRHGMLWNRLGVALVVGLVGLLLVGFGVASADEDHKDTETFVTRLEPGNNLVGWTTQSTQVDSLFAAVPQIQHVWAWDPSRRQWRFAGHTIPRSLWSLHALSPGMGLRIQVNGHDPVDWQRPRRPVQGTVNLSEGWNLVAWMGRDEAPLDLAARGVGRSLRHIGVWNTSTQSLSLHDAQAIISDHPERLDYGDAVWINVERTVRWLQPTGILPQIIIAGAVPDRIDKEIRADIEQSLDFYYEAFGLEADFARFQIYIPTDIDALVNARQEHLDFPPDPASDRHSISSIWKSLGWANTGYMVVKAHLWTSIPENRPRTSLISPGGEVTQHEYAHVLQSQLSGRLRFADEQSPFIGYGVGNLHPPLWLQEGMANWVGHVYLARNGHDWVDSREATKVSALGGLPLAVSERSGDINYAGGTAAAFQLAPNPTDHALFEFFRSVGRSHFGSVNQFTTLSPWRVAFEQVFGLTLVDFYESYNREHEAGSESLGIHAHDHEPPFVSGTITGDPSLNGQDLRIWLLPAFRPASSSFDWVTVGEAFQLSAFAGETYNVAIEFTGIPCMAYLANGNLVQFQTDADKFTLSREGISDVTISIPENPCSNVVSLRIVSESGMPLSGVSARFTQSGFYLGEGVSGLTEADGTVSMYIWPDTVGEVMVALGEVCGPARVGQLRGNGLEPIDQPRVPGAIAVRQQGDDTLVVTVPDAWCSQFLKGRITDANGVAVAEARAFAEGSTRSDASATTDGDGRFQMYVPVSGTYRIRLSIDRCTLFYGQDQPVGSYAQAALVSVQESGATSVTVQLSKGMCELRISGRVLKSDGTPLASQTVLARGSAGSAGATSGRDGFFSLSVPLSGSYRLSLWSRGCSMYHSHQGLTADRNSASEIEVSDFDVTGIVFRLPDNPSSFCD